MKPLLDKHWHTQNKFRLLFAISWSWLLLIDVGLIADSVVVGYGNLLVVYLFMVLVSAYLATKFVQSGFLSLKRSSWRTVLLMVLLWAAFEFFLASVFVFLFWGSGSSWDDVMPFSSLTPLIMQSPFRFLGRMFGYFGTSAVFGTGIVLLFLGAKWRKTAAIYWIALICLSFGSYVIYRVPSGPVLRTTIVSEKLAEPQPVDTAGSDFILLPEYGLDNYEGPDVSERFQPSDKEVSFSGTRLVNDIDGSHNVLVYGTNKQGYLKQSEKSRLIVGGEFMPYSMEVVVRTIAPITYDQFKLTRLVIKGPEQPKPFVLANGITVANAACSSIMNPDDYRRLTQQGAVLLANSASLEIFRGSRLFGMYHDGFAKFMAVANARPFLQSANNWKAFALDKDGNTIKSIEPVGTALVTAQTNSKKTPYTLLGEWVVFLGIIYLLSKLVLHMRHIKPWSKKS